MASPAKKQTEGMEPTPEDLRIHLLHLAELLPESVATQVRELASKVKQSTWYEWQKLIQSQEIRAIDMQEAANKISAEKARQLRIAIAMRGLS